MAAKVVAVWYLLLGMSVSLTGQTNAYFTDTTGITETIQAGTWETEDDAEEEQGQEELETTEELDEPEIMEDLIEPEKKEDLADAENQEEPVELKNKKMKRH